MGWVALFKRARKNNTKVTTSNILTSIKLKVNMLFNVVK